MAEEDVKPSKASKFLKKSKWGKVLKQSDDLDVAPQHEGAFRLNEDVVDFLKPSTEKSRPKIDIAIANRWPEAHQLQHLNGASSPPPDTTFTKPKRRKGLTVSFARTAPEVIGEGGDEAPDPPREISRHKAAVARSSSDRRPGSNGNLTTSPPPVPAQPKPHIQSPPPPPRESIDGEFGHPAMRRQQSSYNELSPPLQRKHASPPPLGDVKPHRRSLGRVSTGFPNTDAEQSNQLDTLVSSMAEPVSVEADVTQSQAEDAPAPLNVASNADGERERGQRSGAPPLAITTAPLAGLRAFLSPSPEPDTATSPVVERGREMTRNEGLTFRRASMLLHKRRSAHEEDERPGSGSQPPSSARMSSNASSPARPAMASPSGSVVSPETASTVDAPNPFADPKYTNRHFDDDPSLTPPPLQPQVQSLRQHRPMQEYNRTDRHNLPTKSSIRTVPLTSPPRLGQHERRSSKDGRDGGLAESTLPSRHVRQTSTPRTGRASDYSRENSQSPNFRNRLYENAGSPEKQLFTRPNGSSTNVNHCSARPSHSRTNSRDDIPGQTLYPGQPPPSPRHFNGAPAGSSPRASLLGPGRTGLTPVPSPKPRASHEEYPGRSGSPQVPHARLPTAALRQEEGARRASAGSQQSSGLPMSSSQLLAEDNPAADAALADFAARVAHMKGVFRLTAERELPSERCNARMWLRAGLWWYSIGKAGLEVQLQRRDPNETRQLLTQAHVDLAKAWWILSDPLEDWDTSGNNASGVQSSSDAEIWMIRRGVAALKHSLKSLSLSITKNRLSPPEQSLIQGQDTRIWIEYPQFTSDAATVLSGNTNRSYIVEDTKRIIDPYEMITLMDHKTYFCYGRFSVSAFLNTDDAETDRVVVPCILTVLRGKHDYQTTVVVASQNELVNIKIQPTQGERRGTTWGNVSWNANSSGLTIHLPRNFDLAIRMQERDYRAVWNLSEYARKVEKCLRAESGETLVHETRLAELQYVDSTNAHAFPPDKVRGCSVFVFERHGKHVDGSGTRKVHRGYRLLLITDPGHKTLSAVNHDIGRRSPFYFEFLTDSAANGTTAMVIRVREEKRQCRILLVFFDGPSRHALHDVLTGLRVSPDEGIVGKMTLVKLNIEPASQSLGFSQSAHPALDGLLWQKLGVTNELPDDENGRTAQTVESEHLRIVARHATGCMTDRLNLGKGELLLRLPLGDAPTIQILRNPQEDMTMSIDTRHSPPQVSGGIAQLLYTVLTQPTVRTFTFASSQDLHAFQAAVTGCVVRFDGMASNFGISRRRMVVPIYKKWEANGVRVQIVSQGAIVQVLAFMEEFSHADAMCFQIKSTDVFENVKSDGKGKKWGVKMVDAKFKLPNRQKGEAEDERFRSRFINLEGLDYAEEHDDITISFDTEQERDRFTTALPAATSASRGISLKRRT